MTIPLILISIITIIQFHSNKKKWANLTQGNWDNNDYNAHCPLLSKMTDSDNASHLYLIMLSYELMIIILSIIIAFDWPENGNVYEFIISLLLIISRITLFLPLILHVINQYRDTHPHNPDEL